MSYQKLNELVYADELDFLQISCRIYSVSVKTIEINIRYVIHHCIRGLYEAIGVLMFLIFQMTMQV